MSIIISQICSIFFTINTCDQTKRVNVEVTIDFVFLSIATVDRFCGSINQQVFFLKLFNLKHYIYRLLIADTNDL